MNPCFHAHGCPFRSHTGFCPDHCIEYGCRILNHTAIHLDKRDEHLALLDRMAQIIARRRPQRRHRKAS